MELLALIGLGGFCGVSAWISLRLLRRWRRTGQAPELLAAIALGAIGPLGFGLTVLSERVVGFAPDVGDAIWMLAAACLNAGTLAAFEFTRRVFHPGSGVARAVVVLAAVLLAFGWAGEWVATGFAASLPASGFTRFSDFLRTSALLWGATSALASHGAGWRWASLRPMSSSDCASGVSGSRGLESPA